VRAYSVVCYSTEPDHALKPLSVNGVS
jgi:hypothetical protein